jgi:hypothetical protein
MLIAAKPLYVRLFLTINGFYTHKMSTIRGLKHGGFKISEVTDALS